jgi:prepilin-type N-terminal cleavage/methylation domain-containing protein
MNHRGFSLIELLIVISVVAILSLALGSTFQGSMAAYRVEGQVKEMQADIMNAQARAMHRNMMHFVQITAAGYQITQDTNQNGALDAGVDTNLFATPKPFRDPVVWGSGTVMLNTRGIISATGGAMPVTLRITSTPPATPDYDCLVISQTRVKTGGWNGASCDIR